MSEFINDRRLVLGALVLGVIAVAAVIIVFFAVPEAAARDTSQTEGDSGVSIQSLTPRASFASGTGVNLLSVEVSRTRKPFELRVAGGCRSGIQRSRGLRGLQLL